MLIFEGVIPANYLEHTPSHKCPGSAPHPPPVKFQAMEELKRKFEAQISGVFVEIRKAWVDLFFFSDVPKGETEKQENNMTTQQKARNRNVHLCFFGSFKHPPPKRFF